MSRGVVIAFYSYKGGVGRSLALANLALMLHQRGARVVVCDLDLEAPGLERYLTKSSAEAEAIRAEQGFVELVAAYDEARSNDERGDASRVANSETRRVFGDIVVPKPSYYLQRLDHPREASFGLLGAGAREVVGAYAANVRELDQATLPTRWGDGAFVELLRDDLTEDVDFVLVDARSGVTELGGFVTHDLADVVVVMTNATDACVDGSLDLVRSLRSPEVKARRNGRELHVLPVASRIDLGRESDELDAFRERFRHDFAGKVSRLVSKDEFLERAEICYVRQYSFGERVIATEDPETRDDELYARYEFLREQLERVASEFKAERDRDLAPRSGGQVFISYRRDDASDAALQIRDGIDAAFGDDTVFLDSTAMKPGVPWREHLESALAASAAVVVLIGPSWLRATDEYGRRLIDDEEDWCRREIEFALRHQIALFPELTGNASMPPPDALPKSIRALEGTQALSIDGDDAVDRLTELAQSLAKPLGRKPSEVAGPATSPIDGDPLVAYRKDLRDVHRHLVSFFSRSQRDLLEEIYVDVEIALARRGKREARDADTAPEVASEVEALDHESQRLTLRKLMERPADTERGGAWVVLGDPGAGKSTIARHLAFTLSEERPNGDKARPIPVFVPLASLVGDDARHPFALAELGLRKRRGDRAADGLQEKLFEIARGAADGEIWLLLDGLDEVAPEHVGDLHGVLFELAKHRPKVRIAVFTRPVGYLTIGAPFESVRLQPLTVDAQQRLIEHWLGDEIAAEFGQQLERRPELRALAGSPLLLTLMARLAAEREKLPDGRIKLYRRAIELLIRTPYQPGADRIRVPHEIGRILGELALELQRHEAAAWTFDELDNALWRARRGDHAAAERVDRLLTTVWGGDHGAFLRDVAEQTGLLAPDDATGEQWTFLHRQFREFFAAEALGVVADRWKSAVGELTDESIGRWGETLGIYCGVTDDPWGVLRALGKASPGATVRALVDVEGPDAGELADFMWKLPYPIENWSWSEETPSPYCWDGDDVARIAKTWHRRGRWPQAADWLWQRVGAERSTVELAWLHFALAGLGPVDDDEFFRRCGRERVEVGIELIAIDGGDFLMGSPEDEVERFEFEGPQHRVHVPSFELARTTITNAQYALFDREHEPENWSDVTAAKLAKHPVVNVSWWEAYLFCVWAGLRLPTEAEWEYACRAGTETPFSFGENITPKVVNYDGNRPYAGGKKGKYRNRTVEVGSLPANPWELHEMHGNVWEWCQDRWHESYKGAPLDGSAWLAGTSTLRVLRGGSWIDDGWFCRSAYRGASAPGSRDGSIGFRPARSSC